MGNADKQEWWSESKKASAVDMSFVMKIDLLVFVVVLES